MLSSGLLEIWLSATQKYLTEPRASRIYKRRKGKRKGMRSQRKVLINIIHHQTLCKSSQNHSKDLILVSLNIHYTSQMYDLYVDIKTEVILQENRIHMICHITANGITTD